MKKYLSIALALLIASMAFAGVYTIGTGNTGGYYVPFSGLWDNGWSKSIYTKAEINAAGLNTANTITGIAFNVTNTPSNYTMQDQRVYVRHTSAAAYDATDIDHPNSALFDAVFQGDLTYNGSGWFSIAFSTPFAWNGSDNIEFLFENHDGDYVTGYPNFAYTSTSPDYLTVYKNQDNSFPQGIDGARIYNRPNIQLYTPMDEPPAPAMILSPADGATFVNVAATLNWQASFGADGYKLYFGTTNPPAYIGDLGDVTTYNPNGLADGSTYYWQVVPYNTYGEATGCPVWSFATTPAGVVMIGDGTVNQYMPVNAYYGYSYNQSIYLQQDINVSNQRIEKIAYYWNGVGAGTNSNEWVVYMGHTDEDVFASTADWIPLSGLTEVYAGTVNIPAAAGWITINLTNPFVYNNTQNLVIAVDENKAGYDSSSYFFFNTNTPGENRSIRAYSDNSNPNPANPPTGASQSLTAAFPNIMMEFGDLPANPIFHYAPTALNFGTLIQDTPSEWQNVTIANTGGGTININANNISIFGTNDTMFEFGDVNLPAALGPGVTAQIPVRATATAEGDLSATLRIVYNAENYDVALSAHGLPAGLFTIGNGTTSSSFPFYSLYEAARTQMLFTAEELLLGGASPGVITHIAYDVINPNDIELNDLMIRFKHTDVTTLTAFDDADLENCYLDVRAIEAAGWNYFIFQTPFLWNGADNLLVDVSFTNDEWSGNSTVNATAAAGKTWARQADGQVGATMTGGTAQTNRPNTRFIMGPPPSGPAAAPLLTYPANGATGLPIEGFDLTWAPNLMNGGAPDYYVVFMSQDEDDLYNDYFETQNTFFNPVTEGGIVLGNDERWFWAVEAQNDEGGDVSDPYFFTTIAPPAQISVNPTSFTETLDVGDSSVQTLTITNAGGLPLHYSIGFAETEGRGVYAPVISNIQPNPNAALYAEKAAHASPQSYDTIRAYLDLQFVYPNADGTGEYGVSSDGEFIYTSKWNSAGDQTFFKYSLDGDYLGSFDIPGFAGVRDMTYDGTYFYGSTASTTIYVMDFANLSLVRTITAPAAARGIAYDADEDGLWITNGWDAPLRLIDLDGTLIRTLNTGASSMAGIAYDAFSGDGTLWAQTQSGDTAFDNLIQIDKNDGSILSTLNLNDTLIPGIFLDDSVGGMDIVSNVVPGYATIIGNLQNAVMYGLELCSVATWAKTDPRSGVVPAGSSVNVDVIFDAHNIAPGVYTGDFIITHNAVTPAVEIPATLTVTGEWPAEYSIDLESWDFGEVEQLNPASKEFTIKNLGGPGLTFEVGDIYIADDIEGNFQVQADLPVELGFNQRFGFDVVFTPQTLGAKTANLKIQDNLGRVLHTYPLSGTGIEETVGQVVNLQANVQNFTDVLLSWGIASSTPGTPGWLHYDDGINSDAIGTGDVANFNVAIKFTGADLWNYSGMQIEKMKFFPYSENTDYILRIWTGSDASLAPTTLMYSQPITNVTKDVWNEVVLNTPFPITQGQAIWIGYNCDVSDGDNMFPAGCDAGPAVVGKGDVIELGGTWYSAQVQYGLDVNWNLQAYVNDSVAPIRGTWLNTPVIAKAHNKADRNSPILRKSGNSTAQQRVLRGFNVYRNNVQINTALVPTPTYLDAGLPNGTYTYTVQAVYYTQLSDMSDPATAIIDAPAPLALPFIERWDSADFGANMWSVEGANWQIDSTFGYPAPSAVYDWSPAQQNYEHALTSYELDATGIDSVYMGFNLHVRSYDDYTDNYMFWEVWNGTEWATIGGYNAAFGDLNWATVYVDISEHAANRVFQIRFVATGEDTYSIWEWGVDNIKVAALPASLDPITDLTVELTATGDFRLSWTENPIADWYIFYISDDPYGDYEELGFIDAITGTIELPASMFGADKQFLKMTVGAGPFPESRNLLENLTK